MQLLLLHSVKCKRLDLDKKSNIDKILPLFGIISDGLKYVFVVLGKAKIWISDVFVASREEDLLEIILVKGNFAGEIMADI
ncbi:hypothetical protein MHBO_003328 [Bonamia ostreae]|uniref:Uncharacterized protein n=1 Tax=Bonamia ostreae TaxID=126728 RepID=A0ABV2AQ41_9EUKA